jgi:hypothetical protein
MEIRTFRLTSDDNYQGLWEVACPQCMPRDADPFECFLCRGAATVQLALRARDAFGSEGVPDDPGR